MARMPVVVEGTTPAVGPTAEMLPVPLVERNSSFELVKRAVDVTAAVLLLVLLAPVLLAIALLVKLDSPGPVLFRQRRYGRDMEPFTFLKFRTMHHGASAELHRRYIEELATGQDSGRTGELKKLTNDPRVTRVGGPLRKLSLDELPQLFNVVVGQMSLVGPRPAIEYELDFYEPRHFERFNVRPGLTGLWQVSGRSELGFREMLDLDVEYSRTCTPGLDARCLLRTPQALVRRAA